eukprot:3443710-Pleurochrysis_carterae.AAC.2
MPNPLCTFVNPLSGLPAPLLLSLAPSSTSCFSIPTPTALGFNSLVPACRAICSFPRSTPSERPPSSRLLLYALPVLILTRPLSRPVFKKVSHAMRSSSRKEVEHAKAIRSGRFATGSREESPVGRHASPVASVVIGIAQESHVPADWANHCPSPVHKAVRTSLNADFVNDTAVKTV